MAKKQVRMKKLFIIFLFQVALSFNLFSNKLHVAAKKGDYEATLLGLVEKNDPNSRDENGCTPLHYAVLYDHGGIVELLLLHNADPDIACNENAHLAQFNLASSYRYTSSKFSASSQLNSVIPKYIILSPNGDIAAYFKSYCKKTRNYGNQKRARESSCDNHRKIKDFHILTKIVIEKIPNFSKSKSKENRPRFPFALPLTSLIFNKAKDCFLATFSGKTFLVLLKENAHLSLTYEGEEMFNAVFSSDEKFILTQTCEYFEDTIPKECNLLLWDRNGNFLFSPTESDAPFALEKISDDDDSSRLFSFVAKKAATVREWAQFFDNTEILEIFNEVEKNKS